MNKLLISIFCIGIGCTHAFHPAMADGDDNGGNGNGCRNRCGDTTNNIDRSKTFNKGGTGIGIGIGKGGNANASASASTNVRSSNKLYNTNVGVNSQGQHQGQHQGQGQDQGQFQSAKAHQGQGQSLTNNGPQVVIEDHSVTTYEAAAVPAGLSQGDPGYNCSMTGGVSGAIPGGGAAIQWSSESINCELGLLYQIGRDDAGTRAKALEAFDVLFTRVMGAAAGVETNPRDPNVRDGR